jgi:hypothetical protein
MKSWKEALNADPTPWLLESENPSVRYLALQWLLDKAPDDHGVVAAQEAIRTYEPVVKLLDAQRPDGRWRKHRKEPYHTIHYYLMALEHFGCPRTEGIETAIEYQFKMAQQEDGALSCYLRERGRSGVIPCYAASALHYLYFWGYGEDPRTQRIIDYLLQNQLEEGGWLCSERVKKRHSCFWATANVLLALEELPPGLKSQASEAAIGPAVELFLERSLYKHHPEFGKPSERWFRFGYPLMAATSILEVLELIAPYVQPDDPRIQEGLELVLSKQKEDGRWLAEIEPWANLGLFEPISHPSKYVTLHAMRMLKRLYK